MATMTDPTEALISFQRFFGTGSLQLHRGDVHPGIFVHVDTPLREPRYTYVQIEGRTVVALAILMKGQPIDRIPCFQAGVAVPKAYRNQGRAKTIIDAAIAEMQAGLARHNITTFYVEGIVGQHNIASQRVSAKVLSNQPTKCTDDVSGLPALQYLRKVEAL